MEDEDVQVERDEQGWTVKRGERRLKRFPLRKREIALHRACEWAWDYASDNGGQAWLVHGNRRSRIAFGVSDDVSEEGQTRNRTDEGRKRGAEPSEPFRRNS